MGRSTIIQYYSKRRSAQKVGTHYGTFLILRTLASPLIRRFNIHLTNGDLLFKIPPPYILLANHQCQYDPVMLHYKVPKMIQYLVADSNFRPFLLRILFKLIGAVSKTKFMPDVLAIKHVLGIVRNRGIIGIFPEGQSSWDGVSLPILPATAKMIKILKIPVIIARIKGSYLTFPIWARKKRRGRVEIEFTMGFRRDEIVQLPLERIVSRISAHIRHDEYAWQRKVHIPFYARARAEYLERLLFICAACRELHTLKSDGNYFFCGACSIRYYFDMYGFLRLVHPGQNAVASALPQFDSVTEWSEWQDHHFFTMIEQYCNRSRLLDDDASPFLSEKNIMLRKGYKTLPLEKLGEGTLHIDDTALIFHSHSPDGTYRFSLGKIEGENIQKGHVLEFYYQSVLYNIKIEGRCGNTYKWLQAIRHFKKIGA